MPETLHIHIGLPKCASTSLQSLCLENVSTLSDYGFYYPFLSEKKMGNAMPLTHHISGAGDSFAFHNPELANIKDIGAFFKKNYLNTELDHVILSSEGFHRGAMNHDHDFIFNEFDEIKVYCVFRPKSAWIQSHFFQGIKTGKYYRELKDLYRDVSFVRRVIQTLSYASIYDFWVNLAGKKNFKIMFLDPGREKIEDQFLKHLLGKVPETIKYPDRLNDSLPVEVCVLLSKFGGPDVSYDEYWGVHRKILAVAKEMGLKKKGKLFSSEMSTFFQGVFFEDDLKFSYRQKELSYEDLWPEVSNEVQTFHHIEKSESYQRLKEKVEDRFKFKVPS